jgi:polar amino acid transport system permease protein
LGGLVLCLVRLYVAPLRPVAIALIEFFRATPIFVQLLWVNYVWPELFGWPKSFFTAGWVALALQSSGYLAETFRAGIEGVPRGHREAAMSVGMPSWLIFTRIVMPQTLLASAPAIVNQITVIIKSSTLVSVITVADLMFRSQQIVNRYYEPIEILTATAAIYIVLVFAISSGGNALASFFFFFVGGVARRYGSGCTVGKLELGDPENEEIQGALKAKDAHIFFPRLRTLAQDVIFK